MQILVIEDEPRMLELLRKGISEHGYTVATARDGVTGMELAMMHAFDVVLLDVGLPGLSGYDVAQILKTRKYPASILMLTAFDKEDDIVSGLNLGADDYLTKPFSFPELMARIRSLTRVVGETKPTHLAAGDLTIDLLQRKVSRGGQGIELTRTEFLLLELLMEHAPGIVSREVLLQGIWGKHPEVGPGALDVLVNSVRGKVDAPFSQKLIQTARRVGYVLRVKIDTGAGGQPGANFQ